MQAFLAFLGLQSSGVAVFGFCKSSSVNRLESSISSVSAVVKDHRDALVVFLGKLMVTELEAEADFVALTS